MRRVLSGLILTALLVMAGAPAAHAQPRTGARTALWTIVGAGAGFGLGVCLGLNAFDDAVDSDRKVWTSALVGAAAGGTLGYLIARPRQPSVTPSMRPRLTEREVGSLAGSVRLRSIRDRHAAMLQSADAHTAAGQF
jgi:hypothetical protein